MATHSSILARKTPWTESLAGDSPWGRKESDMTEATEHACTHTRTHCSLPGASVGGILGHYKKKRQ